MTAGGGSTADDDRCGFGGEAEGELATRERRGTRRPRRHKVLLHNDDYTTMEFVVEVLVEHFHKSPPEALQIMLQVHHKGSGVAGVYPPEVAETKVAEVTARARAAGFPLLLTVEDA
jgi:ATP-dependent Clp protease adaptor protein ClpS